MSRRNSLQDFHDAIVARGVKLDWKSCEWVGPCFLCGQGNDCFHVGEKGGTILAGCRKCNGSDNAAWFRKMCSDLFGNSSGEPVRYAESRPANDKHAPQQEISPSSEPSGDLKHDTHGTPVKAWPVRDSAGDLWAIHALFQATGRKAYRWWRDGKWGLGGLPVSCLPLWGSEGLKENKVGDRIYVTEGAKAAQELASIGVTALATVTGASGCPAPSSLECLRGRVVVLWPDRDDVGIQHMGKVAAALGGIAAEVRVIDAENLDALPLKSGKTELLNDGADAVEWLEHRDSREPETLREELDEIAEGAEVIQPTTTIASTSLKPLSLSSFLGLEIKPQESIAGDLWQAESLNMIYAPRGKGKSWFSYSLAVSIAAVGESLSDWPVSKPRKVLLIDGEMSAHWIQQRFSRLAIGCGAVTIPAETIPDRGDFEEFIRPGGLVPRSVTSEALKQLQTVPLEILSNTHGHRSCGGGIPDLDTEKGRQFVEAHLGKVDVLILDNYSSLFRSGEENDSASWAAAGDWLVKLRAMGLMIVLVHHSGKSGDQRGTSRREDAMDVIVKLSEPDDYDEEGGCQLIAELTKARHLSGFTAGRRRLDLKPTPGGGLWFNSRFVADDQKEEALALHREGKSCREIAKAIGSTKSTVGRWTKEAEN